MTKLLFDRDKCKDVVKVNLSNATSYLNKAGNTARSLNSMSFSYSSYVAGLSSKIANINERNSKVILWLVDSIAGYGNYINENVNSYDKFEAVEVKKIESNVNKLY